MLTYPESQLQRVDDLLNLLGSFWATSFTDDNEVLPSLLYARAQRDMQSHLNLLELVASMSRFNVPVFHTENWRPLILLESTMNRTPRNVVRYGDGNVYGTNDLNYGQASLTDGYSWLTDSSLADAKVLLNRITRSSKTLLRDVDFTFDQQEKTLVFNTNPFDNELFTVVNLFENNEIVDRQVILWLYRGQYDWQTVFQQFGYTLGLFAESSENYKALINAVFDSLVEGTSVRAVQAAWSALCDVPLAKTQEQVEEILSLPEKTVVVTTANVYEFKPDANVIVAVDDTLQAGDSLTDSLQFYDLNRGVVSDDVGALCVGPGLLPSGYFSDLVFKNQLVDLIVEENVQGYTKVSFELDGLATDAEKFWDDVHQAGIASGTTLAMLLDTRTDADTQPTAIALPKKVNPLHFLVSNVLRNNTYLVSIKPASFGAAAVKLPYSTISRRTVPPHTLGIVLIELVNPVDTVKMDTGTAEQSQLLPITVTEEEVSGQNVVERVRFRAITGRCI